MKKLLAAFLAAVMAFGCMTVAFADDDARYTCPGCGLAFSADQYNLHIAYCAEYAIYKRDLTSTTVTTETAVSVLTCNGCGATFSSYDTYNEHIAICASLNAQKDTLNFNYILGKLLEIFETEATWWDAIEDVVIRLIDYVENMINLSASQGEVAGAVADLETETEKLNIPDDIFSYIEGLITSLKQKIKAFYAGSTETTAVETTGAEAPAETGSSSAGAAAFALLSLGAAAAFVCMKKKNN